MDQKIATGSQDRTAKVWNMSDGLLVIATLDGHAGRITSVAISHNGSKVVTGSDKTAKIWNLQPDLFETLKKLTLKQVIFLTWLHDLVSKGEKSQLYSIDTYKCCLHRTICITARSHQDYGKTLCKI